MEPKEKLKAYLRGMGVTEASKKLGVSRQTIYNWLRGTHGFTLKNYKKLQDQGIV